MRPAVVYGLLHAGLAIARSLGRDGVPVEGIARQRYEFGLRSRYLRRRTLAPDDDAVLEALRHAAAQGERPVLFLERDENVDTVLRRWDEIRDLADVPLPDDPEAVRRLRRKDLLPEVAAEAGVPSPYTVRADSPEAILDGGLKPPLLVKPLERQEFAAALGEKTVPAATVEEAVAAWKRAREKGFETVVQELVPDSHEQVYSLFTYVGREGLPLASVVGRKIRQGPLRFGTSAVFASGHDEEVHDLGQRILAAVDYRGLGHVERRRSLAYQRGSDVLLMLLPQAGERGSPVLPGKVFEYLAAERPILAAVPPDGAAANLIREAGAGVVVPPDDVGAIREALVGLEARWRSGRLNGTPLEPALRDRISRRRRIEELSELLLKLAG